MGVSRKLVRWFLGRTADGRTEVGGAIVRGMISCAILGATILSFNLIAAAPSGAAGTLSGWMDINGNIQYDGVGSFGWSDAGTPTIASVRPTAPGTRSDRRARPAARA